MNFETILQARSALQAKNSEMETDREEGEEGSIVETETCGQEGKGENEQAKEMNTNSAKKRTRGERGGRKRQKTTGSSLPTDFPLSSAPQFFPPSTGFQIGTPQPMSQGYLGNSFAAQTPAGPQRWQRPRSVAEAVPRPAWDRRRRPHEASGDGGVALGFNFWQRHRDGEACRGAQVIPADLQNLIIGILTGSRIPPFLRQKEVKARHMVVAVIDSMDPAELQDLEENGFLRSFSSFPVRISEHYGNKPKYNEPCEIEKLLLWKQEPSIDLKELNGSSLEIIFGSYALIFQAEHPEWTDAVVFSPEQNIDDKIHIATSLGKTTGDESKETNITCHGIIRRLSSSDKGRWFLEESVLVIEWWNYPEDRLEMNYPATVEDAENLIFSTISVSEDGEATQSTTKQAEKQDASSAAPAAAAAATPPPPPPPKKPRGGGGGGGGGLRLALTYAAPAPCPPPPPTGEEAARRAAPALAAEPTDGALRELCLSAGLRRRLGVPVSRAEEGGDGEYAEVAAAPPAAAAAAAGGAAAAAGTAAAAAGTAAAAAAHGHQKLVAVDCEMSYTEAGLELTRVTLVNHKSETLYDTIVKPARPITDFNTQYSGITEKDMQGPTVSLQEAQAKLMEFIGPETYVAGHSIDSDLRALKLIHHRIIDTAVLYPSPRGLPFKNSLKNLTKRYLGRQIQESEDGHDSAQDAVATLQLVLLKAHRTASAAAAAGAPDPAFGLPALWETERHPPKQTLFGALGRLAGEPLRCVVSGYGAAGPREGPGDNEPAALPERECSGSVPVPAGGEGGGGGAAGAAAAAPPLWLRLARGYCREADPVVVAGLAAQEKGKEEGKEHEGGGGGGGGGRCAVAVAAAPSARRALGRALSALGGAAPPDLLWARLPYRPRRRRRHRSSSPGAPGEDGGDGGAAAAGGEGEGGAGGGGGGEGAAGEGRGGGGGGGGEKAEEGSAAGEGAAWSSPEEIDDALKALYEVAPDDCLIMVLVQPPLAPLRAALEGKTKGRWDAKALANRDHIAGAEHTLRLWEDEDEEYLVQCAANALEGVAYLKHT